MGSCSVCGRSLENFDSAMAVCPVCSAVIDWSKSLDVVSLVDKEITGFPKASMSEFINSILLELTRALRRISNGKYLKSNFMLVEVPGDVYPAYKLQHYLRDDNILFTLEDGGIKILNVYGFDYSQELGLESGIFQAFNGIVRMGLPIHCLDFIVVKTIFSNVRIVRSEDTQTGCDVYAW